MKRKMMAFLMVCVFLFVALPVYAVEASFDVHVSADRKEAAVGDTVHYTVIAKGEDVIALQFDVVVPEGMRYVPDSGATPKGLNTSLGVAAAGWTEQTMRFSFYNDQAVQIPEGTVLLTFDCVITAEGSHQVSLTGVSPYDSDFAGFQPATQYDTVIVGEKNGEGETQTQPVPPEGETQAPDSGTPGIGAPSDGAGDSAGEGTEPPLDSVGGSEGNTTEGTTGGSTPDTGSTDVPSDDVVTGTPSDDVGSSVEGSTGTSSDSGNGSGTGSTGSASGNAGNPEEGNTDITTGNSDATSPDSSTSSSDSSVSSDTAVSKPQGNYSEQGTEPADDQQPGHNSIVSAEDTVPQQPENETFPQQNEEEMTPAEDELFTSTPEKSENTFPAEENEDETVPSAPKDGAQDNGEQMNWLWPILVVTGVLVCAAVIILIVKKKR